MVISQKQAKVYASWHNQQKFVTTSKNHSKKSRKARDIIFVVLNQEFKGDSNQSILVTFIKT